MTSLQADWLLKHVTCLTFSNWPLAIWQAELQATPIASLSWAETDQFTPLQLFLQLFHLVVILCCKLDLKCKNREGRVKQSCFLGSLMLQLVWFSDVAYPSFRVVRVSGWHVKQRTLTLETRVWILSPTCCCSYASNAFSSKLWCWRWLNHWH